MKRGLAALVLCCGGSLIGNPAAAQEPAKMVALTVKRDFFTDYGLGTVGFVRNARSGADAVADARVQVLPADGAYTLPRKAGHYWFKVNHLTTEFSGASYIGVLVAKFWPPSAIAGTQTQLYRNTSWNRPGDADFNGGAEASQPVPLRYEEFLTLHSDERGLSRLDRHFKWHGVPEGGRANSWDQRSFWADAVNTLSGAGFKRAFPTPLPNDVKTDVQSYLLRFAPMPALTAQSMPPTFKFAADDRLLGVYVRLFSPAHAEFSREFYFSFSD